MVRLSGTWIRGRLTRRPWIARSARLLLLLPLQGLAEDLAIGCSYMHVSNAYLSLPQNDDNGINVYGPMIGFNVRLGGPKKKVR